MPASSSALPAGSIFGLSFFEPMMIPTCGSSTSISVKASSTVAIVAVWVGSAGGSAGVAVPVGWGSSEISLIRSSQVLILLVNLTGSAGDPLDGAGGDVGADLHSLELDPAGCIVRTIAGFGGTATQPGHVQHPAAGGDDLAVALRRAGMRDLGEFRRLGKAGDHVAAGGGLGVAGGGEDDGHRPVVAELGGGACQSTGLAGSEEELGEVGTQPRQHRLGLGIAE